MTQPPVSLLAMLVCVLTVVAGCGTPGADGSEAPGPAGPGGSGRPGARSLTGGGWTGGAAGDIVSPMPTRRRKVALSISSSQRTVRVPRKRIAALVDFVARSEGVPVAEVDLAVVGAGEIAALNRRYLAHGGATDVLSFDLSESGRGGLCMQLVVCSDLAAAQAAARGLSPQGELMLYVVHGLLHQMGYEDSSIRGAAKMHARQEQLLVEFLHRRRR